jgi:hypothetical protein
MSNAGDFIIENGVLTKYVGPDGDVVIPDEVVEIGEGAFAAHNNIIIHASKIFSRSSGILLILLLHWV